MANSFLKILPFRPQRPNPTPEPMDRGRPPKVILPAEDILDFEYPPKSPFNRDGTEKVEETLIKD